MRLTDEQRQELSALTLEGLERAREAGKKLGCPTPSNGGKASAKLRREAAIARDQVWLAAAGTGSLAERADRLNAAGCRTTEGKKFSAATVSRMMRRAAPKLS